MSDEPSWDLYRTFGAVLRHGSLSAAARMLGLTQPTVARQIDALEAALGIELFVRTSRGLTPTAAATRMQPDVDALSQAAGALLRNAAVPGEVSGTVRVTAGETVGTEWLPSILAGLRRSYPHLYLELSLSDTIEDLSQREADIAVRMVEPTQKTLLSQRVRTVEIGLYAHEDYLSTYGMPLHPDDLDTHDVIGFDAQTPVVREALDRFPWFRHIRFALRADSALAQFAAIRSGMGIGYCQVALAARTPGLVRVLKSRFSLTYGMWVVMHQSLRNNVACKTIFNGIATAFNEEIVDPDSLRQPKIGR